MGVRTRVMMPHIQMCVDGDDGVRGGGGGPWEWWWWTARGGGVLVVVVVAAAVLPFVGVAVLVAYCWCQWWHRH
jgi:hypothetical protein